MVDVVDEEGCPAAAAEFVKEFIPGYRAANRMGHRKPAAWNNPAVAQHDDSAFPLKTPGEVLHDRRLADTGRADNVHYTMRLQSRMGLIDEFSTGKPYTSNLIFDFVQSVVGCFRQAGIDRSQVRSLIKPEPMLCRQRGDDSRAVQCSACSGAGASFNNQNRPQIRRAVSLIGREVQARPLARPMLIVGPGEFKIENQDLEAAQQPPNCFIIGGRPRD